MVYGLFHCDVKQSWENWIANKQKKVVFNGMELELELELLGIMSCRC